MPRYPDDSPSWAMAIEKKMWSQVIVEEVHSFAGGAVSTLRQVTPHPPQPSARAFRSGDETRSTAISEIGESILGGGRRRVVAVGTSAWHFSLALQLGTSAWHFSLALPLGTSAWHFSLALQLGTSARSS